MINYQQFALSAAPRTGAGWFMKACETAGFQADSGDVHQPQQHTGFSVSLVRNPYDWLVSLHLCCKGRHVSNRLIRELLRLADRYADTHDFIQAYLTYCPGEVTRAFDSYPVSTVLRMEDFPWAVTDFLQPFGVPAITLWKIEQEPAINCRQGIYHLPNFNLRSMVMRADKEFCERYNYL